MTPTLQLSHRRKAVWIAVALVSVLALGGLVALWQAHAKSQATEIARIDCVTVTALVDRAVKDARSTLNSADKETTATEWNALDKLLHDIPSCDEKADTATIRSEIQDMRGYLTQLQQAREDLMTAGKSVEWSTVEKERDEVIAQAEELLEELSDFSENLADDDYEKPAVLAVVEAMQQVEMAIGHAKASESIATATETTNQLRERIEILREAKENLEAEESSDDESISPAPPRVERPTPVQRPRSHSNYYRRPPMTTTPPGDSGGSSNSPSPTTPPTSAPSSDPPPAPDPIPVEPDSPEPAPEPETPVSSSTDTDGGTP